MTQICPLCGVSSDRVLNGVHIDTDTGFFLYPGGSIKITSSEAKVLDGLMRALPRPSTREYLMDCIYGLFPSREDPDHKIICVFIHRLRKKLRETPFAIETVDMDSGGYRLVKRDGSLNIF